MHAIGNKREQYQLKRHLPVGMSKGEEQVIMYGALGALSGYISLWMRRILSGDTLVFRQANTDRDLRVTLDKEGHLLVKATGNDWTIAEIRHFVLAVHEERDRSTNKA